MNMQNNVKQQQNVTAKKERNPKRTKGPLHYVLSSDDEVCI